MSTTTQILFNSPALHSLKRDQLVKLCKIHSLKASGKNKELIERLQVHAKTLPHDNPLSIAVRSDDPDAKTAPDSDDDASSHSAKVHSGSINIFRPSEQWEEVMDTIAEVDEETLRSNRGTSNRPVGEFGTNTSKASVTSSLRAIATSLGLKRNTSKTNGASSSSSSLSSNEVVQSSSTLPTSDQNGGSDEPPVEPIPGQSRLQGFPAPAGARLSLSQEPTTTTIRLVSNPTVNTEILLSPPKLKPFATSFDLLPATPGGTGTSSVTVWPFSPGGTTRGSLYPTIPTFEKFGDLKKQESLQYDNSDMDIDMPGGLTVPSIREPTPASAQFNTGATPKSTTKPSAGPVDIFSPVPKPQDASTRSRLAIPKSQPFVFGSPLPKNNMSNLQFRTAAQSVLDEMNKRLAEEGVETVDVNVLNSRRTSTDESREKQGSNGRARVGDMFEKIHQKEFDKMDSITSHYAAKRGAQSTVIQPILSKKRKSSLIVKERKSGMPGARHRPNGLRVASGASVKMLLGDFGDEGDEDDEVADRRLSKRPRVEREESDTPAQPEKPSLVPPPDPDEEARKQKEREAIRRRLDHNKAKRRSSLGRPSLGRAPAPKPTRFGFFASAKTLVQHVWNRGAGSKAIPATKPAQPKQVTKGPSKPTDTKKTAVVLGSSGAPPAGSQTKRIPSGGSNNSVQANVPGRSTLAPPMASGEGGGTAASSRIWKSSIPSGLSAAPNPRSSTIAGHGQSKNRGDSLVGFSSLGGKGGLSANDSRGSFTSNIRVSAANPQKDATTIIPRSRTSSTLMAPTASSLAKTNSTLTKASSKLRFGMSPPPSNTLDQMTNSPQSPGRPAKIFSQPLSPPLEGRPAVLSLTGAATSIVGDSKDKQKTVPSKLVARKAKVLPGRRPRISRSKVIARLASQRAAVGTGSTGSGSGVGPETRIGRPGGKVRSSTGAQVAGRTRQSYSGTRGGDMMMHAKKRVRQSEHARRKSRMTGSDSRMDVD